MNNNNDELITAEDIEGAADAAFLDVEVPEWTPKSMKDAGKIKKIRLQCMTAREAIDFTKLSADPARRDEAMIRVIQLCAVNDKGEKLFTERQIEVLGKKSFDVLNRLQHDALKVCGFGKKNMEAQEAARKNDSGEAPSGASPTA